MPVAGYTIFNCHDVKWLMRDDVLTPVKERLIPDLSSSKFFEQNVPIKKGKRKSLWLFTLPGDKEDKAYIIKRYSSDQFLARLKNLIRPSKAFRELKAAVAIARKNILTTIPIAIGEKGSWGLVKEGYVVIERLKECQDLNSYFLKEHPVRKYFLLTKDTTGGVKLYLSDFEKIAIKRSLSFYQKVRCLAKLNRVGREINTPDRIRFLKYYMGGDKSKQQVLTLAKTIQEHTIYLLKQDNSRGRITSVYTDALYEKCEQKDIKGYYRKGYKIEEILSIIHRFDLLAKSLPSSDMKQREEIHMKLSCDGNVQLLKVVRYINHPKNISASTLWTKMSTLSMAGIPLDIPHVFMEMKVKGNQEGYLFIPKRENEVLLGEFLKPSLEKKEFLFLIELLLKLMKKLHCLGTFSDKISEGYFTVVEKTGCKPSIYINNIERFDIKKAGLVSEKKRELAVLNALIKKHYPMMSFDLTQRYSTSARGTKLKK